MNKNKKIIVTGGSGFLGSHVADILSNNGYFKDGERIGRWIEYYSNGKIKSNRLKNYRKRSIYNWSKRRRFRRKKTTQSPNSIDKLAMPFSTFPR